MITTEHIVQTIYHS